MLERTCCFTVAVCNGEVSSNSGLDPRIANDGDVRPCGTTSGTCPSKSNLRNFRVAKRARTGTGGRWCFCNDEKKQKQSRGKTYLDVSR
jgi:hypothetical protein